MSEIKQYLHGRRSIIQRELVLLEAKVNSMTLELKEVKEAIEYQQQLEDKR